MTDREHIYTCESCGAPIYAGDKACTFYSEITLCFDHAVKRSSEIEAWEAALDDGSWGELLESDNFSSVAEVEAHLAKLRAVLEAEGDGPATLVTV